MAAKTIVKILTEYFNQGEAKRATSVWAAELKALTADEKRALAEGVCAITGDTIIAATA